MRIVMVGAGDLTVQAATAMVARRYEVVVIEEDRETIERLSQKLDCSFLHGDGSKPEILREADPAQTDVLMCLSDDDQSNIVGCLVGRSLGFKRVVAQIRDPDFEPICQELGLEDYIVPARTIASYLTDLAAGLDILNLSAMLKGEARLFAWPLKKDDPRSVGELGLPAQARAVCYFRNGDFHLIEDDARLHEGDEVVVLTHSKNLEKLRARWQ